MGGSYSQCGCACHHVYKARELKCVTCSFHTSKIARRVKYCCLTSVHPRLWAFWPFPRRCLWVFVKTAFRCSIVCFGDTWRQACDILTSRVRNMHALVGARRNFCNVIFFLPRLSSDSPCVPVVKRVDPTLTDKEANIGHPQFLDIVDLYDVISSHALHCQFQPGNVWYSHSKIDVTDNQYIVYWHVL